MSDDWEEVADGFKRRYGKTKAYRRAKKLAKKGGMSMAEVMQLVLTVGEARDRLQAGLPARNAEEDEWMSVWMELLFDPGKVGVDDE